MTLLGAPAPRIDAAIPTPSAEETLLELAPASSLEAEETVLGPPRPARPSFADLVDLEGATLLDSLGPRAMGAAPLVTPADAYPAVASWVEPALEAVPAAGAPTVAQRPLLDTGGRAAVERMAAARLEAAETLSAEVARRRRLRRLGVLLALAAVAAVGAAAVARWLRDDFHVELGGDLAVTRTSSGYAVQVEVRASHPATVRHPGGRELLQGTQRLHFEVDDEAITLGDNTLTLQVTPADGPPRTLTLHVMVYYRLRAGALSAPEPGRPVIARLLIQPGWTVELQSPGTVEIVRPGEARLSLAPEPLLARVDSLPGREGVLPVRFVLRAPDGARHAFDESLRMPLPETALALMEPPRGWAQPSGQVRISGRTSPEAVVRVGQRTATADADGRFSLPVALPALGAHTLMVEADAPARRPTRRPVTVERLTLEEWRRRRAVQRARADELGAADAPAYGSLVVDAAALQGRALRFSGRLVGVHRGAAPEPDSAEIATCTEPGGCPIWARLEGPILAAAGGTVTVVGRLAGTHAYRTPAGVERVAPRLDAAVLLP